MIDVIAQMPKDKSRSPDRFVWAFSKACCATIKHGIMAMINNFSRLIIEHIKRLNSANIVILPKKNGDECITDFRPINRIRMEY